MWMDPLTVKVGEGEVVTALATRGRGDSHCTHDAIIRGVGINRA